MARSSRLESGFQDGLIQRLKNMFPGCMVFKMDQYKGFLICWSCIKISGRP